MSPSYLNTYFPPVSHRVHDSHQQHLQHPDPQSLFTVTYSYQQLLQLLNVLDNERINFKEWCVRIQTLAHIPKIYTCGTSLMPSLNLHRSQGHKQKERNPWTLRFFKLGMSRGRQISKNTCREGEAKNNYETVRRLTYTTGNNPSLRFTKMSFDTYYE